MGLARSRGRLATLAAWCLILVACESEPITIFVDVLTDMEPGVDFDAGDVLVFFEESAEPIATSSFVAEPGVSFATGARVAELSGGMPGQYVVEVVLTLAGEEVARQRVRFIAASSYGVTVPFPVEPCVPDDETCNGVDDDCDDVIDEGDALILCALDGVAEPSCESGACQVVTCTDGLLDCDSDPATGCEIDGQTDSASCGGCGMACDAADTCDRGTCRGFGKYLDDLSVDYDVLGLEGRDDGGFAVHAATGRREESLFVYGPDGTLEWSDTLFLQPGLSMIRHVLRGVRWGPDGSLHALVGNHNPTTDFTMIDILGVTVEALPISMKYVHARWEPDGTLADVQPLPTVHICDEAEPCEGVLLVDVDDAGRFYIAGVDPGISVLRPHVYVSVFAADGTGAGAARIDTGFGRNGFWRGAEGDGTGRTLGWTESFSRRDTIDFGDGEVTVNPGVTAAVLYDSTPAPVWSRRYRGQVLGAALRPGGGFAVAVLDEGRHYVETRADDGSLESTFDLPFESLPFDHFEVGPGGDFHLIGQLARSIDFGGGIRSPLLSSVFVASYTPEGEYRYDRLFGNDSADVLLRDASRAGARFVFAGDVTGEIDFGGGVRTGPSDFIWTLGD